MFAIIKEIGAYLVYLVLITVLVYDNVDLNAFPSNDHIKNTFVDKFNKINSFGKFWIWTNKTLLPNLYFTSLYNGEPGHWRKNYYLEDEVFFKVGSPRFRLAKVKKGGCEVQEIMRDEIKSCLPTYGISTYDDNDYAEGWQPLTNETSTDPKETEPWLYKSTLELDGTPTMGLISTYSGGGYVIDLGTELQGAQSIADYLVDNKWIDQTSRAVFTEFNLYNPASNLFTAVQLVLELPEMGSAIPYPLVSTIRLYSYVGSRALYRLILELLFVCFTIYYIVREAKNYRKVGFKIYVKSFWTILELIGIITSIVACGFYGAKFIAVKLTMNSFHDNKEKFLNIEYAMAWDGALTYTLGFLVYIVTMKFLRLLRFNMKVTELTSTLRLSTRPLINFLLFFAVIFWAFTMFGYSVFGRLNKDYNNCVATMETLFAMMLMNFDFQSLYESNRWLGPLFFLAYVMVLAFVVINMFVTILNESYYEVKQNGQLTSDDYQMVDYMLEQFKGVLGIDGNEKKKKDTSEKEGNEPEECIGYDF